MTETSAPSLSAGSIESADYNEFVHGLVLLEVNTVRLVAEALRPGLSPETTYELRASVATEESHLFLRYDAAASLLGDDGDPVARIETALVLVFRIDSTPPPEIVEHFGSTSGTLMAHPYLREALQSLSARLGYPGVLLPLRVATPE